MKNEHPIDERDEGFNEYIRLVSKAAKQLIEVLLKDDKEALTQFTNVWLNETHLLGKKGCSDEFGVDRSTAKDIIMQADKMVTKMKNEDPSKNVKKLEEYLKKQYKMYALASCFGLTIVDDNDDMLPCHKADLINLLYVNARYCLSEITKSSVKSGNCQIARDKLGILEEYFKNNHCPEEEEICFNLQYDNEEQYIRSMRLDIKFSRWHRIFIAYIKTLKKSNNETAKSLMDLKEKLLTELADVEYNTNSMCDEELYKYHENKLERLCKEHPETRRFNTYDLMKKAHAKSREIRKRSSKNKAMDPFNCLWKINSK